MTGDSNDVVRRVLDLPLLQASWVFWLLCGLSIASVALMVERALFFRRHTIDLAALTSAFDGLLGENDYAGAARLLEKHDALETNVVLVAVRKHTAGPDAVEDLMAGALPKERERYDANLDYLATLASNAPFVGLFGTVLGIIRAFKDLAGNMQHASTAVMSGVAEALVTTAIGLFVAIPALVAFNLFKRRVKKSVNNAQLLSRMLLAHLKSVA